MQHQDRDAMNASKERELQAIGERYQRRQPTHLYSILRPEVLWSTQEWQRQLVLMLARTGGYASPDLERLRLVDVGCGYGGLLLDFLRIGFQPQHLTGLELLPDRAENARAKLPPSVTFHVGDASSAPLDTASQDIVFQSVVLSSILDDDFQKLLAHAMWSWVRPGGAVVSYDFVYSNPANPDVRAVPVRRLKELFPQGRITYRRVTLAPPISRRACKISPSAYTLLNAFPFLRTHVLAWIAKPLEPSQSR